MRTTSQRSLCSQCRNEHFHVPVAGYLAFSSLSWDFRGERWRLVLLSCQSRAGTSRSLLTSSLVYMAVRADILCLLSQCICPQKCSSAVTEVAQLALPSCQLPSSLHSFQFLLALCAHGLFLGTAWESGKDKLQLKTVILLFLVW